MNKNEAEYGKAGASNGVPLDSWVKVLEWNDKHLRREVRVWYKGIFTLGLGSHRLVRAQAKCFGYFGREILKLKIKKLVLLKLKL